MTIDTVAVRGVLTITRSDRHGKVLETYTTTNLLVNTGAQFIVSKLLGTSSTLITHMQVGSGTTAPVVTNTNLQTPVGVREPVIAVPSTFLVSGDSAQFTATFGSNFPGAISEAGLFTAVTGGSMICRTVFPVINKGQEDVLTIVWVLTVGSAT
jgi:hypothetical protein